MPGGCSCARCRDDEDGESSGSSSECCLLLLCLGPRPNSIAADASDSANCR